MTPGFKTTGFIHKYNQERAYGFIKADEPGRDDVYFHQKQLPRDMQNKHSREIIGSKVGFEFCTTKDGKDRCDSLWVISPPGGGGGYGDREGGPARRRGGPGDLPPPPQERPPRRRKREDKDRNKDRNKEDLPELELDLVQDMTHFLEDHGGSFDFGKFTNAFRGYKKCQLAPHFAFSSQGDGHVLVALRGTQLPEGGDVEVELEDDDDFGIEEEYSPGGEGDLPPLAESDRDLGLEPSFALRLLGRIVEWDRRSISGIAVTEGYQNIQVDTDALPQELKDRRDVDLVGCEVTFGLETTPDGKLQAQDVHVLLMPDDDGGWRLRRV